MRGRLTTFAFVVYVALDLSNPFMPGAFTFNPEQCVEATQSAERQVAAGGIAGEATPARPREPLAAGHHLVRRVVAPESRTAWRSPVPVAHAAPPPSSRPSSEDH